MWLDTPFLNHTLERQSSGLPGHQQGGRGLLQQWENSLHLRSGCSWPEKEILHWALKAEAVCDTVIPPSLTLQWCFPKSVSPVTCILLGVQTVFYSSLYPSSLSSLSPDTLTNVCWVQECMNNSSFGIGCWFLGSLQTGKTAQTTSNIFLGFLNSFGIWPLVPPRPIYVFSFHTRENWRSWKVSTYRWIRPENHMHHTFSWVIFYISG